LRFQANTFGCEISFYPPGICGSVSRRLSPPNAAPPPELALGTTPLPRVSVFMSVFDCHMNRAPVSGRVERIVYMPGKFLNADLDKASEDNERNALVLAADAGRVQIAGLIARRIKCWTREGQAMNAGERIAMIRFGSRVDVYLPAGTIPLVSEGQTSLAGETVIAEIGAAPKSRSFRVD
jgi:phosphatidylserine decarboxylase